MAVRDDAETPDVMKRIFTVRSGSLIFLAFCVGVSFFSVGITALLAVALGKGLQAKMGSLGQIFESVNAVFSGLGFIALVITFRLQHAELRLQRQELAYQREAMNRTQVQLRRSAKADIRTCHVELMRLSMADPDLAVVWPEFQAGPSTTVTKQFIYANLIVQHQRMMFDLGFFTEEDIRALFRYLFTSSTMQGFWEARMVARHVITRPGSPEWTFDLLVDAAYGDMRATDTIPGQSEHIADVPRDAQSDAA